MVRFLFSLIIFAFIAFPANAQNYLWPTDSGLFLSSTFGETRSSHFHAGLDIKTWGREGYRVFAARDGKIHRLLITERGYGKAIYVKHPDNTFTVYAHLQRFNDNLQALADSIRLEDYSFELEMNFDSLNIAVNQGDVIGYTGSSGIGPPHLHFEVRDSLDNPLNALTTNLSVKDDRAPVFSSLIIEPMQVNSKVDGKPYSNTFTTTSRNEGEYSFGEIGITGKIGLAVDVYDLANNVPNKYAIYQLSLLHEGDTLFHQQLDTFNYDHSSEMFLDRIAPFGASRRSYHRLYAKEGSKNPFYLKSLPASVIEPADTSKTYTIIASDYFGNTSKAEVTFRKDLHNVNTDPGLANPLKDWYWTENWASPDLANTLDFTNLQFDFPWRYNQQLLYTESNKPINFTRITPGEHTKVITPDRRLQIYFGKEAFFDTLTIAASYTIDEEEVFISVQPQMLSAKSNFKIEFYLDDDFQPNENYRLFRVNRNNKLSYIKSKLIGRTIHAYPSKLGEFVIKADNDPPLVYNFRIKKTDYHQWLGLVSVEDELSGIDSKTAEYRINGERGIAEYDYEEKLLIFYLPGFVPAANNTAEIIIKDKAGNESKVTFEK